MFICVFLDMFWFGLVDWVQCGVDLVVDCYGVVVDFFDLCQVDGGIGFDFVYLLFCLYLFYLYMYLVDMGIELCGDCGIFFQVFIYFDCVE